MTATRWRVTATTVVLALTASACSNSSTELDTTPESDTAAPAAGADTGDMFVGRHGAVTVTVTENAVTGPVDIIVTAADTPTLDELSDISGAVVAHTGVDVTLTGGTLTGTADIVFELPDGFDYEQLVPIVAWETDVLDRWELLPTRVDQAAGTITATTNHFSFGWFGWIDPAQLVEPIRAWVADLVFGRAGAGHPTCGDERSPRDAGIEVISDSGDLVMWCFGHDNGRDVLKVTNNWRAAQQVSFRSNWQATGFSGAGINLQGLYDWLATIATTTPTVTTRLIPPGGTIVIETVDIPSDHWAVVAVEPSVGSWAWSGALLGVDVLMAIYGKLLKADLREQAEAALATAELAKCFSETYGSDAAQTIWTNTTSDPQELFDTVVEALRFGLECGHQIIVDILKDAGTNPVITTAIGAVGIAVGIGVGLIGTITAGTRAIFEEVTALFDDSQLTSYGYAVALTVSTTTAAESSVEEKLLATFPNWNIFYAGAPLDCGANQIPAVRVYAFDPSVEASSFVEIYADSGDAEDALLGQLAVVEAASRAPVECIGDGGSVERYEAPASVTQVGDRWQVLRTVAFGDSGTFTNERVVRLCGDALIWEDVATPGLTAPLGC